MDVFTTIVVPGHRLDEHFDVIVNSADFLVLDKIKLCEIAFAKLGSGYGFTNSLLIDDDGWTVERFNILGGLGYQYVDDEDFLKWKNRLGSGMK